MSCYHSYNTIATWLQHSQHLLQPLKILFLSDCYWLQLVTTQFQAQLISESCNPLLPNYYLCSKLLLVVISYQQLKINYYSFATQLLLVAISYWFNCNQVLLLATSNYYQLQPSYHSNCNLITTSYNPVTCNQLLLSCKSIVTPIASKITDEPNYRDQCSKQYIQL